MKLVLASKNRLSGNLGEVFGRVRYVKLPKAMHFRPLLKTSNSRFLSQKTPYHAG